MKKSLATVLVSLAFVTANTWGPAPASAHTDVCAGQGLFTSSAGVGLPGLSPPRTASYVVDFLVGVCSVKTAAFGAAGTMTGWCGLAWGTGTTNNSPGHSFSFTWSGTTMTFTGEVTGELYVAEDGNCRNGTAARFAAGGALSKTHTTPTVTPPLQTVCQATATVC